MPPININQLANFLQAVGYHAAIFQTLLPMYLHLIVSALFPIFTGSHASLSRPSSAAKPTKKTKKSDDNSDSDDFEQEQKMEGLSPTDAILMPVMGGLTLVGLYYLIKYLEDPAILNKIMNWYFALFGTLSLARLLTDTMGTIWSFVFPNTYQQDGEIWKIDPKARKAWATKKTQLGKQSPLPGHLAFLPLPSTVTNFLWAVREIPSCKFRIQTYIHNNLKASFRLGPLGLASIALAFAVELYFNLIDKPWWLMNLLGFSFTYAALQILSPTTAWTGTLILSGLFFYDIYFVFFTPMMVTVATQIDIPAKLLFPRPEAEGMSMLGLGDVVLPGMIIGFALRFDLFCFYLRKQTKAKAAAVPHRNTRSSTEDNSMAKAGEMETVKAKWIPAAGGWGERFWTPVASTNVAVKQGGVFPKTYFYATITGYVIGLLVTLGVMQVFEHAQPALLYLVPGVLCALWGTALVRGEVEILRNFSEAEEENDEEGEKKEDKEDAKPSAKSDWTNWFVMGRMPKRMEETKMKEAAQRNESSRKDVVNGKVEEPGVFIETGKDDEKAEKGAAEPKIWDGKLISLSISLQRPSCKE